jgi:hypothetical protein
VMRYLTFTTISSRLVTPSFALPCSCIAAPARSHDSKVATGTNNFLVQAD